MKSVLNIKWNARPMVLCIYIMIIIILVVVYLYLSVFRFFIQTPIRAKHCTEELEIRD